jgi:isopenicillin-N N-acyltransferase like protein
MTTGRKWLRRLAWWGGGLVVGGAGLFGGMTALMWHWVAPPPALASPPALTQLAVAPRGDRVYLGANWLGQREGLPVLYLTGTPFEMGYANGVLTQRLIQRQEATMVQLFHRAAPYRWTQFLLKFLVVYKNRHLPEHVLPEHQLEMLGLSRGCPDTQPEMGPYFNRILNYHAAQDISYMLMNSPLLHRGCTAFGAWGSRTQEGHLWTGRNFDWEPDPVFDRDRLVILCEPKEGIPFVSLAWAGMAGCVSGMNRAGLSVTVNGAPSNLPGDAATPTCLVAREVLQRAHTLAEATELIRRRKVFVSALFLVGSRADGRFVVIEKTPDRMAVSEPKATNFIVCANHYQTPELKEDPLNAEFKRVDTSVSRFDRLQELLEQSSPPLNASRCAELLRDRRLPGGRFAGNGHRSSLNPLIATHAVLMDLTAGVFWAASPPHQLGRFVAFDVNDWENARPAETVAADPMLATGEYERHRVAVAKLEEGLQALQKQAFAAAAECARQAEKANPGFYRNSWLLAESLLRQGQPAEAARACQEALDRQPALGGERKRIEQLAREIAGTDRTAHGKH